MDTERNMEMVIGMVLEMEIQAKAETNTRTETEMGNTDMEIAWEMDTGDRDGDRDGSG